MADFFGLLLLFDKALRSSAPLVFPRSKFCYHLPSLNAEAQSKFDKRLSRNEGTCVQTVMS
jgi:hypothetical protein